MKDHHIGLSHCFPLWRNYCGKAHPPILMEHLKPPNHQHGFRKIHSTTTALHMIHEHIVVNTIRLLQVQLQCG